MLVLSLIIDINASILKYIFHDLAWSVAFALHGFLDDINGVLKCCIREQIHVPNPA